MPVIWGTNMHALIVWLRATMFRTVTCCEERISVCRLLPYIAQAFCLCGKLSKWCQVTLYGDNVEGHKKPAKSILNHWLIDYFSSHFHRWPRWHIIHIHPQVSELSADMVHQYTVKAPNSVGWKLNELMTLVNVWRWREVTVLPVACSGDIRSHYCRVSSQVTHCWSSAETSFTRCECATDWHYWCS